MTSKQRRVPQLRFKNDGGEYPEWEEVALGKMSRITTGKLNANAMVPNGQYRFYTCAKDYFYIDNYAFDTDALLISGNGANVGYIHHYKGKFNAYQRTYVLDKFTSNIIFIKYYLEKFLRNVILSEKKEGNTPYIVKSTLSDLPISSPIESEQHKIASFLSSVDSWIRNLEKQKTSLGKYKRGIMQKIFSQEIRFKDDDGSDYLKWENKSLTSLVTLITKGTTPTSMGFSYTKKGINFIKAENINGHSEIDIKDTMKISLECDEALSRSSLAVNDILFSIAGTLGRTAIINNKHLPANTNQALAIIRLKNKKSVIFIEKFLNSIFVKKYILQMVSVGAQPNLSLRQIGNIQVNLPSDKEQQKIASFLSLIDDLIESKNNQIKKAKKWKKGLLQQMFV